MAPIDITDNLEQLKNALSNKVIGCGAILNLTYVACEHNYSHIVKWLVTTYLLIFNIQQTRSTLRCYILWTNHNTDSWNLIFGRLPATYYHQLMTHSIRRFVELKWHPFLINRSQFLMSKNIPLFLESQYSC
jgi:hypothetical protein